MAIIVKLEGATNFWDPTQSQEENKKLSGKAVKELEKTKKVSLALKAGGLAVATQDELKAYKKLKRAQGSKSVASKKSLSEAKKALELAEEKLAESLEVNKGLSERIVEQEEKINALQSEVNDLIELPENPAKPNDESDK